jgi:hypothetical protein
MSCTSCFTNTQNRCFSKNLSWETAFANAGTNNTCAAIGGIDCVYPGGTGANYVIISDSSAAVLYAGRLLCNGVPGSNIFILTAGQDNIQLYPDITDVNWTQTRNNEALILGDSLTYATLPNPTAANTSTALPQGIAQAVWDYIMRNQFQVASAGAANQLTVKSYYRGRGILGDLSATYIVPRTGPWFIGTDTRLQQRFFTSTQTFSLNPVEVQIYSQLRQRFRLFSSCLNMVVNTNSIMLNAAPNQQCPFSGISQGYQMVFLEPPTNSSDTPWCPPTVSLSDYTRQLYQSVRDAILSQGVRFITGVTSVSITGNTNGTVSIQYQPTPSTVGGANPPPDPITNANIIWLTNSFDYTRWVNTSGAANLYPSSNIPTPLTYRTVVNIPVVNCQGIDLTGCINANVNVDNGLVLGAVGDGVTSYISFSLRANSNTTNSPGAAPVWFVQAYTTNADHYPVSPNTANAEASVNLPNDANSTLLIIEAINTQFVRRVNWDGTRITVTYAEPLQEARALQDFLVIAANVLNIYTGQDFPNEQAVAEFFFNLKPSQSGNTSTLPTTVAASTRTNVEREMTISTVVQIGSWLYGNSAYPCPWSRRANGRCASGGCQALTSNQTIVNLANIAGSGLAVNNGFISGTGVNMVPPGLIG